LHAASFVHTTRCADAIGEEQTRDHVRAAPCVRPSRPIPWDVFEHAHSRDATAAERQHCQTQHVETHKAVSYNVVRATRCV